MKRILFSGFIFLMSLPAVGQNFQAIQDNGHRLFNMEYGIRGIDVYSTESSGDDLIFHLSNSTQPADIDGYCLNPHGPSWMGEHVRISPDGTHLFFNLEGDTIRFQLQAETGESWTVYDANGFSIQGEIVSLQEETILEGIQDLVKTVSFQAMNSDMEPVNHYVNGLIVKFSENYGVIQTLNFITFPIGLESYYYLPLMELSLVGIEGLDVGVQNLTSKDVFDFQPGDELHVKTKEVSSSGNSYEVHTVFRYLDRVDQGDSIVYIRQVESDNYSISFGEYIYTGFSSETGEYVVQPNEQLDLPSYSPFFSSGNNSDTSYHYYKQLNQTPRIKLIEGGDAIYTSESGCYYQLIDGGCNTDLDGQYIEKRGGPYYYCMYGTSLYSFSSRELVYYNIDGVEWGTPFSLLLNADVVDKNDFKIYPNPAQDRIFVDYPKGQLTIQIEIMDLQGRIVKSENLPHSRSEVSLEDLPPGVFIYRILSGNEILTTGKMVVQR